MSGKQKPHVATPPKQSRPVPLAEAKTRFPSLVAAVEAGEEVIITRDDVPVVRMVPVRSDRKAAFGALKGQISAPPSFFDPLPEEELEGWH